VGVKGERKKEKGEEIIIIRISLVDAFSFLFFSFLFFSFFGGGVGWELTGMYLICMSLLPENKGWRRS